MALPVASFLLACLLLAPPAGNDVTEESFPSAGLLMEDMIHPGRCPDPALDGVIRVIDGYGRPIVGARVSRRTTDRTGIVWIRAPEHSCGSPSCMRSARRLRIEAPSRPPVDIQ